MWALVTGASRGIGRAIAYALAQQGYDIVLNFATQREAAQASAAQIEALGRAAHLAPFNVTLAAECEAAIEALVAQYGCPQVLVNNAGMRRDGMFALMGQQAWEQVLDTNLSSFYHVTRPMVRHMLRQRAGRIVSISSVAGMRGSAGQVNYAASKAGLIGATKALALELAPRGITVNAVAPGFIATELVADLSPEKILPHVPLGRLGTPEEVAATVAFLCSVGAAYITGQVIGVSGGLYT